MTYMKKSFHAFFVSLIALILAAPIAGVNSSLVFSDSQLLPTEQVDLARSSYGVSIEYYGENTGLNYLNRNEFDNLLLIFIRTSKKFSSLSLYL